jgi:Lon protease-like protein
VTQRLPLFPLGTVLYPGLVLPLHVFEDRYRALVHDLLARPEESRHFGVVAIRSGVEAGPSRPDLYDVGCVATVHGVEPYDDGAFDLVTTGTQRFRVHELDTSRPYLQAEVTLLDETTGEDTEPLATQVLALWSAYRAALVGPEDAIETPDDPTVLSYLVAASAVLDLTDKQSLLEAADTADRLQRERVLLRRELSVFSVLPSLPAVDMVRTVVSPN